jgi:hypothetical protein
VKAFGFNGKGRPQVYTRVAVCTPSTIAYNPVEPEKQDIIIVLDAVKAIGDDNQWRLQRAVKARFYGILNAERSMSPHEEDLVRMMFGFDELLIPRPGHQARPVQVVWSRGNSRPIRFEPRNVLDLKRFGVWDDDERNRQVARIARAFLHGDGEALARLLKPCPPSNCGSPLNTFIVVENIEHAMKLVPKLPGWSVLSSGLTDMNGLTENEKTALEDSYSIQAKPACGIITHGGMHHHRTPWSKVDVLIRADAGTGLPDLPTLAQAQLATESPRPLVIVDLDDVHHDELMRRANDRWDAYCGNGWLLPGLDLTSFRISEFLRYHGIGRKGFKR